MIESSDNAVTVVGVTPTQSVVLEFLAEEPGRVDRFLLEHSRELLIGFLDPTELARQSKLPEWTVRNAWQRILAPMAAHPRPHGWKRVS